VRVRTIQVCFPRRMIYRFLAFRLDGPHRYLFDVYPTTIYASDASNHSLSGPPSPSHEPIPFPSLRAPSPLPPDAPHHSSDTLPPTSAPSDDYSWEWGGFPQRSQVHVQYATLQGPCPPEIVNGAESDEQLSVSQPEEFQRSKSLPPEFELDLPEEAASSLQTSEQLPGQEPVSDIETGYDHGLRTSGRERRSWVRWWRRDSRHPQSVDVRIERPPVRSAASTPLPIVSRVLCSCGSKQVNLKRRRRELHPFMFSLRTRAPAPRLSSHCLHLF
jgi:hypothetical protein